MSRVRSADCWAPVFALIVVAAIGGEASAAGSGMPWEGPLEQILDSITGPVARAAGVIAMVLLGIGFAFTENGGVMRKAVGVAFGLAFAFSAASWGLQFFGFAGGAML